MTPRGFDRYMVAVGAGTHPKFARLTVSERYAHFLGVLAIAARSPVRGRLLVGRLPAEPVDVAQAAGVPEKVAQVAMEKLEAVGVLVPDEEHGCLRVHDWDDINPSPGAERSRRWRNGNGTPERHKNVTETSRAVTKTSPEVEVEVKTEGSKVLGTSSGVADADEKSTEDDNRLCRLLAELAKTRNPKFKVKSRSRWLTEMRLLRERDDNTPQEIEQAIRWLFTDPGRDAQFWADTVQSAANLREHFPTIWAKMSAGPKLRAVPDVEDSAAFLRRRGVA